MANFCGTCGKPLSPKDQFCPQCGVLDGEHGDLKSSRSGTKRKNKLPRLIIVAVVLVAVVYVVGNLRTGRVSNTFLRPPVEQNLVDKSVTIPSGSAYQTIFTVERNASLIGDFRAFGGGGNDIQVLLMDETAYINWSNGHQVTVYYDSGKMTMGRINVSLRPGKYVLVFSNAFSLLSQKVVDAHIKLRSS
jgi:hypothetical protein